MCVCMLCDRDCVVCVCGCYVIEIVCELSEKGSVVCVLM